MRTITKHIVRKTTELFIILYLPWLISQQKDLHTSSTCHDSQMLPTANNQQGILISK